MDYRGVLSQIGTEEKAIDRRHQSGYVREQCDGRLPRKVSDRAAEERDERRIGQLRKREWLGDVGNDRNDPDLGIVRLELERGRFQEITAHIDRDVRLGAALRAHGIENEPRLRRTPGAELHQRAWLDESDDLPNDGLQQCPLGAREVILGQLGDLLEEVGATLVVEVLRGQLLRGGRQAAPYIADHLLPRSAHCVGRSATRYVMPAGVVHISRAQRMPLKIWRRMG